MRRSTMCNANHANCLWIYQDARGVEHRGHMKNFSDRGGTDVTYWFHDCATDELSLVSGQRLKAARRTTEFCDKREAYLASFVQVEYRA